MLKIINCNNENYINKLKRYLDSNEINTANRIKKVSKIIKEVKEGGDKSLLNFTKKYDKNNIKNIKEIEVSKNELENSIRLCSKDFLKSTKLAIQRIKSYQKITS